MKTLADEVKYWKLLSKKYDELDYEFNVRTQISQNEKTTSLVQLMQNCLKVLPEHRDLFDSFAQLKESVIQMVHPIKVYVKQYRSCTSAWNNVLVDY